MEKENQPVLIARFPDAGVDADVNECADVDDDATLALGMAN